jgi:hypothetical protein
MNNAIYLSMKWLDNPESVIQEERDKNKKEAKAYDVKAYLDYSSAIEACVTNASSTSVIDATYAAFAAASAAAENDPRSAKYWITEYFKYSGENKQDYINAIEEEK